MIIVNTDLWETDKIVKLHSTEWQSDSSLMTTCALEKLKNMIQSCIEQKIRCVLLVDCNKGSFPPFFQALKIAKFLFGLKAIIKDGLDFTILLVKNETHKKWINRILSLYTPARPLHILDTKKEARAMLEKRLLIQK